MSLDDTISDRGCERQRADRKAHLPRLNPQWYQGRAFVHWTLGIERRETGWLTEKFHHAWREVLIHATARYGLVVPAYVLMPDHIHLLVLGTWLDSDQRLAIQFVRRQLHSSLLPAQWRSEPYDHVLREEERTTGAFESTAHYVLNNPVRAKLAATAAEYPYIGCCIPGYPEFDVRNADYWPRLWRCYAYLSQ